MTMHIYHETPWQDDCPRCQEWAEHPFTYLDSDNLRDLHDLTVEFMRIGYMDLPVSEVHLKAVRRMERHLIESRALLHALGMVMYAP
jgi:hypothetical protein